jgi:hypothetical protein
MTIDVDTSEFESSHGKKPRGRGDWAFGFTRRARMEDLFWVYNQPYGAAVKAAKAKARALGADTIYVQP